ncbi:MAG TPA: hypothetical protein VGG20_03835 [Thermoanaerobaculia bacterium]|jgi:hypothetical protein
MRSRSYRRILTLALCLSTGASALAHAQGPPARSAAVRAALNVQERSAGRTLLEAAQNLWAGIRDFSWGPPPPPPHGDRPSHQEGPGICPHGHM